MASREGIKSRLSELGVSPRKSRGQNFILNEDLASALADDAEITEDDLVIEIGPGLGVMTKYLTAKGRGFKAVELEESFAKALPSSIQGLETANVINADVTKTSVREIWPDGNVVVVGNIPYTISSQIVVWLLDNWPNVKRASLLVQREFAERIAAEPGSKQYGILSVQCALLADASLGRVVKGDSFVPRAKVDSQLLQLNFKERTKTKVQCRDFFRKVVRESFGMRRKTLINNLVARKLAASKIEAELILQELGLDTRVRAEVLDFMQFAELSNRLEKQ